MWRVIARYFGKKFLVLMSNWASATIALFLNIPEKQTRRSALIRWWRAITSSLISIPLISFKALAVNLCDLAAMGGRSALADAGITGRRRSVA